MAINKKLIHFRNKQKFEEELAKGNILDTSIVFIQDTTEIYTHGQLYDCSPVDSKVFIGTKSQYQTAYSENKISTGALVIILEQDELETSTVTSLLGTAILGKMILGTN